MAHRTILDDSGVSWQVWEVVIHPAEHHRDERLASTARRLRQLPEQRENLLRRRQMERRVAIPPAFVHGWLAFSSSVGTRRFGPIPQDWTTLSDLELNELCTRAEMTEAS